MDGNQIVIEVDLGQFADSLKGRRVRGLTWRDATGGRHRALARREVLLCAGALAAAERSDIVIVDGKIRVTQRKPVNFEASGSMTSRVFARALPGTDRGNMNLASLGDARLGAISADGETRIKVRGSIVNAGSNTPAVQTGNLILEAAEGGIGYIPDTGSGAVSSRRIRPISRS